MLDMAATEPEFDVTIFGASGFTGVQVALYFAQRQTQVGSPLKWALAGRDEGKLRRLRERLVREVDEKLADMPLVVARLSEASTQAPPLQLSSRPSYPEGKGTVDGMVQRSRLIVNCVGPFRFFGEEVVQACVRHGRMYVDVTGEPQFIETMAFKYHEEAQRTGALLVPCSGFDSIPADLGVLFTARQFPANDPCASVESVLSMGPAPHGVSAGYATWESAVNSFAAVRDLHTLRTAVKAKRMQQDREADLRAQSRLVRPPSSTSSSSSPPAPAGAFPPKRRAIWYDQRTRKYCLPFPGSDAAVVRQSQYSLALRDPPLLPCFPFFTPYLGVSSRLALLGLSLMGLFLRLLAPYTWGRALLLRFYTLFTFGLFVKPGPSARQMASNSTFLDFFGRSRSGQRSVHVRMEGPDVYIQTAVLVSEAALCLLEPKQRERCPPAGVYTPAAAFAQTDLMDRIAAGGVRFSVQAASV